AEALDSPAHYVFNAIPALQPVVEAGEVAVCVLAFHPAHRRSDLLSFLLGDPVACRFDPAVAGPVQVFVAIAAPGTRRIGGRVDRGAFSRRPPLLVLAPHPAGLLGSLIPRPGRNGNRAVLVVVALLAATGLGWDRPVATASAAAGTGVTVRRLSHLTRPV